ncbi:glycosyltransferase [Streptomyces sp. NPDC017868]|uniref:glycosyltransferase n=1 Tax=unclassified Streptomyces TaxID=2593676 RepID=UPI0037BD1344
MQHLRDTVLILNHRFLPQGRHAPYLYGVVQHAVRAADILHLNGGRVAFVLYRRRDGLRRPRVRPLHVFGRYPAVSLEFHYGMTDAELTDAFRTAIRAAGGEEGEPSPVVYYQTSAVLPYAPPEFDSLITHHSPFVTHVAEAIGWPAAQQAFDWDHAKARHLQHVQQRGLDVVRRRERLLCAEISPLQVRRLRAEGVPAGRVTALAQPLDGAVGRARLPEELAGLPLSSGLLAVTAVSRLDHFKNVELFVAGCRLAIENGDLARAVVIGGFPEDAERERLRASIPRELRERFVFTPRTGRDALVGRFFPSLAGKAVFVCSSRFDLVPYTALEAARSGLCTVVADVGSVGVQEMLPEQYRFQATPAGLADCLKRLAHDPSGIRDFSGTSAEIRHATSDGAFLSGFRELCGRFQRSRTSGL